MSLANKIFYLALSFVVGTLLASFVSIEMFIAWIIILTALVAVFVLHIFKIKHKKYWLAVLIILGLSLAVFRFGFSEPSQSSIYFFDPRDEREQVEFTADIIEVHSKISSQQLILDNIFIAGQSYRDKVAVGLALYPEYQTGHKVSLICDLKRPSKIEKFDYEEYLANKKIYKVCYYPQIKEINEIDSKNIFLKIKLAFDGLQASLRDKIDQNFGGQKAVILKAMILGNKDEFPPELTDRFAKAGISHMVAISGMHIAILSAILFYFFLLLGIGRDRSFKYIFMCLVFYLVLIGFRASAMRAGFLVLVALYGFKIGRLSEIKRTLVLAAFFLLIINPRLLIFDVGFQLSFLAVFSILFFYQPVKNLLDKVSKFSKINSLIAVTMSAQILTLPVVYLNFGILSIVSILTNLLVVPILPIILVLGILFLILSWLPFVALLPIIFLLEFVLGYILIITDLAIRLPGAFF